MARKPRIEFEGAFYHVIVRGNQKQKTFRDDADYAKYHQLLTIYKNRYQHSVYAYVLMSNHVHLLIETREIPLSRIMQGITQSYTLYFNKKYRTVGHLVQGRYKAILCDREAYLLSLLKYIHENPLRAGLTEDLNAYPWSSHLAYTGKSNPLSLVDTDQVLRMFSESKVRARRRYAAFMSDMETMKKNDVYATIDQRLQGDEEFVNSVQKRSEQEIKKERKKQEYSLPAISGAIKQKYEITLAELRSAGKEKRGMLARRVLTQTANLYGHRGKEIALYLKKDPASVTGYLREEDHSSEVNELIKDLERARKNVNSEV